MSKMKYKYQAFTLHCIYYRKYSSYISFM
uniref:Uncharacterized protein n=1 Tax=Anguilla anguilla TaxID=7936 RepID=A0A0E9SG28_ANGAN